MSVTSNQHAFSESGNSPPAMPRGYKPMLASPPEPPVKLCECGRCSLPAPIATKTDTRKGWVKGQAKKYISGHNNHEPQPMAKRVETFWNQIDKVNGSAPAHRPELGRCWPWIGGSVDEDGRGHINIGGKHQSSANFAFFLTYGHWPTPQGCHKCDFPACCNPEHIFEGTQQDNIRDMVAKGRQAGVPGNTNSRKLSDQEIAEIRWLCSAGEPQQSIAAHYGISQGSVSHINTGSTWVGFKSSKGTCHE